MDVHDVAALRRAGSDHARSSRTTAGSSSADPTTTSGSQHASRSGARKRSSTTTGELALDARHDSATPACRTSTRSKATSRTCRGSTSPTARAPVHPAPWYIGIRQPPYFVDAEERLEDGGRRGRASTATPSPACRSTVTLTQIQWNSVRRARATASTRGTPSARKCRPAVDGHDDGRAGAARRADRRTAATSCSRRAPTRTPGAFAVTRDVVLRARRRLHRVGALRPQPHRPRAGAQDLQAGRHRADHDPVAVGAGDGAGHDRARRRPHAPAVRADVDAAVDHRADHRRPTSRTSSCRCCSSRDERTQRRERGDRGRTTTPAIPASRRSASATSS